MPRDIWLRSRYRLYGPPRIARNWLRVLHITLICVSLDDFLGEKDRTIRPKARIVFTLKFITKSAEKPRHSCRGGIGVGRAGLNAQEPNKTYAVPEPSMGEGTA
jgi:hypothetical protein